jgi:hypothetical protein
MANVAVMAAMANQPWQLNKIHQCQLSKAVIISWEHRKCEINNDEWRRKKGEEIC